MESVDEDGREAEGRLVVASSVDGEVVYTVGGSCWEQRKKNLTDSLHDLTCKIEVSRQHGLHRKCMTRCVEIEHSTNEIEVLPVHGRGSDTEMQHRYKKEKNLSIYVEAVANCD